MPFTFSHPLLVIPFIKKKYKFSSTALIIGSMVPDIEFIGSLQQTQNYAHHFPGIFLFNIPVGLMLCFFFHVLVKVNLVPMLPVFLRDRFAYTLENDWLLYARSNFIWLIGSILIGVFSHLLWDEFTHGNGIINNGWSFLHINLMLFNQQFPIHLALQVLSSVIGLVVLFWFIFKKPVNNSTYKVVNKYYWLHFLLIALALIFFRFFIGEFNNSFWDVVVAFMGIGFYALFINSLFQIFLEQIQARKEP